MPIATIIDIGTNTFEYLIVDYAKDDFEFVAEDKIHVRLGEGGIGKGRITGAALERAEEAMDQIGLLSKDHGCEIRVARATSATRDAQNGTELRRIVESRGFDLEVIDGVEEARLISLGASLSVPESVDSYILMDIGGGSTEFILVEDGRATWSQSFNIGVTRIMEKFGVSDPLTDDNLRAVSSFLNDELRPLFDQTRNKELTLIGSAGSYDSIVSMLSESGDLPSSDGFQGIPLSIFDSLYARLIASTKKERSQMPGLVKYRIPTIHLAAFQVDHVLRNTGIQHLARSPFALKEGVLVELMKALRA